MRTKRGLCVFFAVLFVLGCVSQAAAAAVPYASGDFSFTVEAGKIAKTSSALPLNANEQVKIQGTYTPASANLDVGLIDAEGYFHYASAKNGKLNIEIKVETRGNYYFAIRNTSSVAVAVDGYINY